MFDRGGGYKFDFLRSLIFPILLIKVWLAIEYRVHMWQLLPQFWCSDICQIRKWFKDNNSGPFY